MTDMTSGGNSAYANTFRISNGSITDPTGAAFQARGIALNDGQMGDAGEILADFPGLNFVRLAIYSYQSPDAYQSFINTMTSHGVVVELEDHQSSDGANVGGSHGNAFTGDELNNELNWYASVAGAYAGNPYVWFGTDNEPPNAGLSPWEQQTYNAIRDAGNNNPIMLELPGGGYLGQTISSYGMDPGVYAGMSNVVADVHLYGWSSGFSTDQQTVDNALSDLVNGAKTMTTQDGTVPVIIGEYGTATDGQNTDANAQQVIQAAQGSSQTSGAIAWSWDTGTASSLSDGYGNLTGYGQQVAQWIAGSGNTGSAASEPPSNAVVSQIDPSQGSSGITFINSTGNTIDLSSGNATVTDNAGGNTFILPSAWNGAVDFTGGVLDAGDTLDLRNALSATDWDGSADTIGNYVSVGSDASGDAVVSVSDTAWGAASAIATIGGAAGLDLNGLLAHAIT